MTQEDFDEATLAEQILYDCTGMLAENHPSIIEAMDKYHQEQVKKLNIDDVSKRYEYRFKAIPPQGGYVTSIIEANSRDEARELINKKYSEICWISSRI